MGVVSARRAVTRSGVGGSAADSHARPVGRDDVVGDVPRIGEVRRAVCLDGLRGVIEDLSADLFGFGGTKAVDR